MKLINKIIYKLSTLTKDSTDLYFDVLKFSGYFKNVERKGNEFLTQLHNNQKLIIRDQNHSDYKVFKQIFIEHEYESIASILKLNNEKFSIPTIIDAGSNVGYTSLYFLGIIPTAEIIAIEPSEKNAEIIRMNCEVNDVSHKVKIYKKALAADETKKFNLDNSFRDGKDWSLSTKEDIDGTIDGISINKIVKDHQLNEISFLKIDIEGAERFIFTKASNLDFLSKTKIISIEIHDEFEIRDEIHSILKSYGFLLLETGEITIGLNSSLF